jgi:hypothetical protein
METQDTGIYMHGPRGNMSTILAFQNNILHAFINALRTDCTTIQVSYDDVSTLKLRSVKEDSDVVDKSI